MSDGEKAVGRIRWKRIVQLLRAVALVLSALAALIAAWRGWGSRV